MGGFPGAIGLSFQDVEVLGSGEKSFTTVFGQELNLCFPAAISQVAGDIYFLVIAFQFGFVLIEDCLVICLHRIFPIGAISTASSVKCWAIP